jgi:hypothetical protein
MLCASANKDFGFYSKWHWGRTIPTAIRHGPLSMGGLDIIDLRTEAGIAAIKLHCDSIFSASETGKMVLVNLYHSQLESGLGVPLLENPSILVSYLTPTWLTSICHFAYQHNNISITMTESCTSPLWNANEQFLMEPHRLESFTPSQAQDINLVRLYLQAYTISYLLAGTDGRTISPYKYKGQRPPLFRPTSFWPRQVPPT